MTTNNQEDKYLWGMGLREAVILALLSAATVAAKMFLRIPLHIPGHFNIIWMFFLVMGMCMVPRHGAGLTMGILTGVLAFVLGFGHEGILVFFKWLAVGLTLEAFAVTKPDFAHKWYMACVAAMSASIVKVVFSMIVNKLFGFSDEAVVSVGAISVLLNASFGFAGGLLAWVLWRRIK